MLIISHAAIRWDAHHANEDVYTKYENSEEKLDFRSVCSASAPDRTPIAIQDCAEPNYKTNRDERLRNVDDPI